MNVHIIFPSIHELASLIFLFCLLFSFILIIFPLFSVFLHKANEDEGEGRSEQFYGYVVFAAVVATLRVLPWALYQVRGKY